jgi:hypothetical protein
VCIYLTAIDNFCYMMTYTITVRQRGCSLLELGKIRIEMMTLFMGFVKYNGNGKFRTLKWGNPELKFQLCPTQATFLQQFTKAFWTLASLSERKIKDNIYLMVVLQRLNKIMMFGDYLIFTKLNFGILTVSCIHLIHLLQLSPGDPC